MCVITSDKTTNYGEKIFKQNQTLGKKKNGQIWLQAQKHLFWLKILLPLGLCTLYVHSYSSPLT